MTTRHALSVVVDGCPKDAMSTAVTRSIPVSNGARGFSVISTFGRGPVRRGSFGSTLSRLERDFLDVDLRAFEDAEAEVGGGLDVGRLASGVGERLQAELPAQLVDELPADRVHRDGVRRHVDGLVGLDHL